MPARPNVEIPGQDPLTQYFDPDYREQTLTWRMREIVKLFTRLLDEEISPRGVTIGQWQCLRVLWSRDGQTQKELSEKLGISSAAAVFAVDLLERDGMALRVPHPTDGRSQLIYLTRKGKSLRKSLLPIARDLQFVAAQDLTDDEIRTFSKVLDQMKGNLEGRVSDRRQRKAKRSAASGG